MPFLLDFSSILFDKQECGFFVVVFFFITDKAIS